MSTEAETTETSVAQQSPEAAPVESPVEESPSTSVETTTEAPPTTATTQTSRTALDSDLLDRLRTVDLDELIRELPPLQGKVGDIAAKLAKRDAQREIARVDAERRQQAEAEAKQRQEQEFLELAENDPMEFASKWKAQKATIDQDQKRQQELASTYASAVSYFDNGVLTPLFEELPDSLKAKFPSNYDGDATEGRQKFLKDYVNVVAEARAQEIAKKLRAEITEAARKQVLAEINGGSPTPDITGGSASSDVCTQDEWSRNRGSSDWVKANLDRINKGVRGGLITG
jgi:hypothetical protein